MEIEYARSFLRIFKKLDAMRRLDNKYGTKMGTSEDRVLYDERKPRVEVLIDIKFHDFGRLAQRKSTALTRQGSQVRTLHRPDA